MERGFNISKTIAMSRICEDTFRFKKAIKNKLTRSLSVGNVQITKPLISRCLGARNELSRILQEKKNAAVQEEADGGKTNSREKEKAGGLGS